MRWGGQLLACFECAVFTWVVTEAGEPRTKARRRSSHDATADATLWFDRARAGVISLTEVRTAADNPLTGCATPGP